MNKYQRGVLIAVGILIAVIQLVGINEHGLDESRGWAISFLISAVLLFIGFGSWDSIISVLFQRGQLNPKGKIQASSHTKSPASEKIENIEVVPPEIMNYGIHISEMDIAIEAHKSYAESHKIFVPLSGNGKSNHWNCCVSVYSSMRYAARKTNMKISGMVWNTIVHSVVVRMASQEKEGVSMGDTGYQGLEDEAYAILKLMDNKVEEAIAGKGAYTIEPVVNTLICLFGGHQDRDALKALSAMILINAEKAHQKIIPEILQNLA